MWFEAKLLGTSSQALGTRKLQGDILSIDGNEVPSIRGQLGEGFQRCAAVLNLCVTLKGELKWEPSVYQLYPLDLLK